MPPQSVYNVVYLTSFVALLMLAICCTSTAADVHRDGTLDDLSHLLNSHSTLFQMWNYTRPAPGHAQDSYFKLIDSLSPWVTAEPKFELPHNNPNIGLIETVNCQDAQYQAVLTGKVRASPRIIVDLIPFGYDVDKLEIRLFENYDVVDVFVIYESTVSLVGGAKPLFFNLVRNTPRFSKFADKIIYLAATTAELASKIPPIGSPKKKYWPLSETMRQRPLIMLQRLDRQIEHFESGKLPLPIHLIDTNIPRLRRLRDLFVLGQKEDGFITQNDADEIPLRSPLAHLKQCETVLDGAGHQGKNTPIMLPTTMYRTNLQWVAQIGDINQCKPKIDLGLGNSPVNAAIWITGPRLWSISSVVGGQNTKRLLKRSMCKFHTGFGSSVHISSIAEPSEVLLKESSVIEGSVKDLSPEFIANGAKGSITSRAIFEELVRPRCGGMMNMHKFNAKEQAMMRENLPIAIKMYPNRYPFIDPDKADRQYSGLIATTIDDEWIKTVKCNQQVWS